MDIIIQKTKSVRTNNEVDADDSFTNNNGKTPSIWYVKKFGAQLLLPN